jgi:eukaryotic-like serine/threonine-protein kinase
MAKLQTGRWWSPEPVVLVTAVDEQPLTHCSFDSRLRRFPMSMTSTSMTSNAELGHRFHFSTLVGDQYGVEQPIGEGSMGFVVRARHLALDETVAIKFLHSELRHDPPAVDRLLQESRALARIESEHVPRVLDVGMTFELGPYVVMEYLDGMSLAALLEKEGRLSPTRAVDYILQVCEALIATHKVGIVHRDIKPDNLFIVHQGELATIKLVDFGICSGPVVAQSSRQKSALFGTPGYMAPERLCDDPSADHRADIWSIGVVLHELVTGRGLFEGETLGEICANILSDAPVALEPDDAVLPPRLRAIIRRCVSRDPERRYQSVEHLVMVLTPLGSLGARLQGRSPDASSREIAPEAEKPAISAVPEPREATGGVRSSRRRSARFVIARGALTVIGVVTGLWLLNMSADNAGDRIDIRPWRNAAGGVITSLVTQLHDFDR